jgi:cobalt-zinc-cadmium efflux system protein
LYEAWTRFFSRPEVATNMMMAVAILGVLVNLVSLRVLHGGAAHSLNVRGAYLEVFSDALASLGVLVAALVIKWTGWLPADPLVSALIAIAILPRTWSLLKEAVDVLLEGTPNDVNLAALREAIGRIPGVAGIHDLHVWTLTSGVHAMSVHAVLGNAAAHQTVLGDVQRCVAREFKISHVTVQIESEGCGEWQTHQ